ncbi:hypothetical protein [Pseudoalteromonas umbrosa]|uniref:hypothetical protein n=1 Tax=Pseudoalteromonas umbrosa TaxID=3048489 RepID=UPI0024C349B2|nr:hypothetical protein [Pseudoalteromonas sp. B95]MDK1290068.1 hypothetical protein [Pseudoalteromonas sp. B95]
MEFSKHLRFQSCNALRSLYAFNTEEHRQVTYLMTGDLPEFDVLADILETQWKQQNIAPDAPTSSLHSLVLGKTEGLLAQFTWTNHEEKRPVMYWETRPDLKDNVLRTESVLVGLSGTAEHNQVTIQFDHQAHGTQQCHWMLTLWVSDNPVARSRYVAHRVGVEFEPNAELVLASNALTADNPTLDVIEFITPIH